MDMEQDYFTLTEQYRSLCAAAAEVDAELEGVSPAQATLRAQRRTQMVRNTIRAYLTQMGGILMKVAQLSRNGLVLSNGRIVYRGNVPTEPFTADTVTQVIERQTNIINLSLKSMAAGGISASGLAKLGSALHTLYAIYDGAEHLTASYLQEEQAACAAKAAALEKKRTELRDAAEKLRMTLEQQEAGLEAENRRFAFVDMTVPKAYERDISLPIAIRRREGELAIPRAWTPLRDGVLHLRIPDADISPAVNFIKALTVQFLYAYPGAEKQILYCCETASDAIDNFLKKLEDTLGQGVFFRGIQQIDSREFDTRVPEAFTLLRQTLKERSALIDGAGLTNIFAYNARHENHIQPPILVILQNYPTGYENCRDLEYFFQNGAKAGIFFLITQSRGDLRRYSYGEETMTDPAKYAGISGRLADAEHMVLGDEVYETLQIENGKILPLLTPIALLKKKASKVLTYEEIGFGQYTAQGDEVGEVLSIPIGKTEDQTYSLEFAVAGKDEAKPIAYLLIGAPLMGKSSLIDCMIFSGGMKYSPDDLQFYLIDFKDGVSSAAYAQESRMPHIRILAQSSKQEEAEIILNTLISEKARRNEIFKAHHFKNLAEYNAANPKHMPRIIVVIDEVQKLFQSESGGDRGRSDRLAAACETIVREGRSTGIHIVLASQDASQQMMRCVGKFVPGRFCFSVAFSDAENILNRQAAQQVQTECNKPGIALVSHDRGMTCRKIRVAYHNSREAEYARQVREKWKAYPTEVAVVGEDSALPVTEAAQKYDLSSNEGGIPAGENYYDHTVVRLPFDETHHSLLLLGENEEIQTDLLSSVLIGALREEAEVKLLDGSKAGTLSMTFGGHPAVRVYDTADYLGMLSDAHEEYKRRQENRRQRYRPYFLVIHGLSTIPDFMENTKREQEVPREEVREEEELPDWYQSDWKSSFRIQSAPAIFGADTFCSMVSHLNLANDFYICFSVDRASSVKRYCATFEECDLQILHAPFTESMADIARSRYRQSLAASCNDNLALVSVKQQAFVKTRFFRYGDDAETHAYIHTLGGKK